MRRELSGMWIGFEFHLQGSNIPVQSCSTMIRRNEYRSGKKREKLHSKGAGASVSRT